MKQWENNHLLDDLPQSTVFPTFVFIIRNFIMKTLLFLIMLVFTGIQAMGQATRSVSYTYFHSRVVADSRNGQACQPGSPNCNGGGPSTVTVNNGCGSDNVTTITNGTYRRFYKSADENLTTLQSLRYVLKNKTQGNKVIYDFTLNPGGGSWTSGTEAVTVDPGNVFSGGGYSQDATITVSNPDGSVKIATPAIPMTMALASDELEQTITPSLIGGCSMATSIVHPFVASEIEYTSIGCVTPSAVVQSLPGVVANNGQTAANGASLYDVKFSSENVDKGGWYLMDGRLVSSIGNLSARDAASIKFGANLPDTRDKYTVAKDASATAFASSGAASTTITANNLPALSGSTTTSGTHAHTITGSTRDDANFLGGQVAGDAAFSNITTSTNTDGGHSHNVSVNTGSPNTPISIIPPSINLYQFIYLGE